MKSLKMILAAAAASTTLASEPAQPGGLDIDIRIGNGENSAQVHNSSYDFNDEIIPLGVAYWSNLVEKKLARR